MLNKVVKCKFFMDEAAKSLQSCPTLCDPIDGNASGSAVPGILQARTLEWVAISFSNVWKWKWKVKVKSFSRDGLFATTWTAAYQAPLSMGLSRQEYWSGLLLPSPMEEEDSTLINSYSENSSISWMSFIIQNLALCLTGSRHWMEYFHLK